MGQSTRARLVFPSRSGRGRHRRLWVLGLCALVIALAAVLSWRLGPRDSGLRAAVSSVVVRTHIPRVESRAEWIVAAAREARVDPNLLAAIMLSESGGRLDAESRVGALGLFQLMPPTAAEWARRLRLPEPTREELLSDGALNALLAASYLRWLEKRYDGHLESMLIAYNAGPGRLERWIREAGGYHAWRAERDAAGDSGVLRYAAKVAHYRAVFADRGHIARPFDRPPAPDGFLIVDAPDATPYGPPAPPAYADVLTLLARSAP